MKALFLLSVVLTASAQTWTGSWTGTLENIPARPNAKPVQVELEIGPIPEAANACTPWKTTYIENGKVMQVKDYKLCRGTEANQWFMDEGNNIRLAMKLLGDTFVCPFKYDKTLLITITRLRGDTIEEDIYTAIDQPANGGVLPLESRGIQRLRFQRKTSK